jgi:hypothetical protein
MRKGLIVFMLASVAGMAYAADKPAEVKAAAPKVASAPATATPAEKGAKGATTQKPALPTPAPAPAPAQTAAPAKSAAMPVPAPAAQEAAPPAPKPKARMKAHKRLPRGDMRHCLELKDNAAIIKCSEQRK